MRPLLFILLCLAMPAAGAADVHLGAQDEESDCDPDVESQECVIYDDTAAVLVSHDGSQLVAARYGDRSEVQRESWSYDHSWQDEHASGRYRNDQGSRVTGAEIGLLDETYRVDRSRCTFAQGQSEDSRSNATSSQGWTSSGRDETCTSGAFVADEDVVLASCTDWGYASSSWDGTGDEHRTNSSYGSRWCRTEPIETPRGEAYYGEGHYHDCTGAWDGETYATQCSSFGGEWAGVWGRDQVVVPIDPRVFP